GRAEAICEGLQLTVGGDLDAPAAPGRFRLMAAAESDVEGDKEVPHLIARGAERELVIVPGNAPFVADGGKFIRDTITVRIDDFGQLGSLHHEDSVVVLDRETKCFVQAGGESAKPHVGEAI